MPFSCQRVNDALHSRALHSRALVKVTGRHQLATVGTRLQSARCVLRSLGSRPISSQLLDRVVYIAMRSLGSSTSQEGDQSHVLDSGVARPKSNPADTTCGSQMSPVLGPPAVELLRPRLAVSHRLAGRQYSGSRFTHAARHSNACASLVITTGKPSRKNPPTSRYR